ncbi:phosphate/phosphite/phosphonate ABC transporter substrate-binding protein [Aminobacter carboxidus]|uniref:ABC-type phosphate/phosphonate transport system substrate-binding protein n=1 Tax=Aminobacter carboxidus TaxID=376165 RepID=A0A8E1WBS4_9HYPH|nr:MULTISPECIES: PhnD/SsuA/transferrin family substrate-binding protein [Aminobacter carboxidus group]MBB6464779.1 ABC-type phosphate/phosphonate transport system substrate-binding protein [Aminobacter lissarensis]MBE1206726.1 PhnD/SsuA/transferrin family substrate-binding protein [Aminobacter carboxidus]
MSDFIAALPMYDWPEMRGEVDAQWARLRTALLQLGIPAPEALARRNTDLPPVSGGIRDTSGTDIAPDPATLPPDEFDLPTLWRHPRLLFGQTCWGPMETTGLAAQVRVIGQPSYDGVEGGRGELYSSAIVVRRGAVTADHAHAPEGELPLIPLDLIRDKRFAFNSHDSMSGFIGISRDLAGLGEGLRIFSDRIESGGHRASILAIAEGRADVATIDCQSWALAQRFEPAARDVVVIGWTAKRKGLPFITGLNSPAVSMAPLFSALARL